MDDPTSLPAHARERIDVADDGCWLWTGRHNGDGYGTWGSRLAHRRVFELLVGPIDSGMTLDHLCRTRHCVRPLCMEQVSSAENIARGESHIWRTRIAECPRGHAYTEANTRRSPEGKRFCLACKREKAAAYRRAH